MGHACVQSCAVLQKIAVCRTRLAALKPHRSINHHEQSTQWHLLVYPSLCLSLSAPPLQERWLSLRLVQLRWNVKSAEVKLVCKINNVSFFDCSGGSCGLCDRIISPPFTLTDKQIRKHVMDVSTSLSGTAWR